VESQGHFSAEINSQGFGTKLIGFSSKADGGNAVFDYDPIGLRVQLTFPIGK